MTTFIDYYLLLHVQRDAPTAVIKASYRAMMQKMQYHPDLGGDEATAQQLNLAISILCDEQKRAEYDQYLAQASTAKAAQSASRAQAKTAQESAQANTQRRQKPESPNTCLPTRAKCPFCEHPHTHHQDGADQYAKALWCSHCGGAATTMAQLQTIGGDELRRIHRHSHAIPAQLWHQWPQAQAMEAMLIDFSPAGCALDCTDIYAIGHTLKVRTDLFDAICRVRFCQPSTESALAQLGLEFITLNLSPGKGNLLSMTA